MRVAGWVGSESKRVRQESKGGRSESKRCREEVSKRVRVSE